MLPELFHETVVQELKQRAYLNLSERDLVQDPWKQFSDQQCFALAEIFIEIVQLELLKKTTPLRAVQLNLTFAGLSELPLSSRSLNLLSQLDRLNIPKDCVSIDTLLSIRNFGIRSLFELLLWLEKLGMHPIPPKKEDAQIQTVTPQPRKKKKTFVENERRVTANVHATETDATVKQLSKKNNVREEFIELIDRMTSLLDGEIAPEDLRFGVSVRLLGVPMLTKETLQHLRVMIVEDYRMYVNALKFIVLGCERIAQNSLFDEIREIVYSATRPEQRDRNSDIYIQYFGWSGGPDMSLAAVGKKYGLTRERIRQLIEWTDKSFMSHSIYSPLISNFSQAVREHCPIRQSDLSEFIRRTWTAQYHLSLTAIKELFDKLHFPSFHLITVRSIRETFAVDESRSQAFCQVNDTATNAVKLKGIVSLADIRKQLDSRLSVSPNEIGMLLSQRSDIDWLDTSKNYFTLRSITSSAFHKKYQKILSAVWCIRIDDLIELLRPTVKQRIPDEIYRAYFDHTPGLTLLPSGFIIVDRKAFGNSLSTTETYIVDILRAYGGVIKRKDLLNELAQHGINPKTVFPLFTVCQAIVHLKRGLFGLPGTKLRR